MKPFANESETIQIADITIENRTDRVTLYGSIDLTRDKEGLAHAQELKKIIDAAVKTLETEQGRGALPDRIAVEATTTVPNPFA
jgi:hypothetical protein